MDQTDRLKGKRILLVEDRPELADILSRLAGRYGIHVTNAQSGSTALDTLKQELPDLILLDLGLPDMKGFDVVTQVRQYEKTSSIPILAMSGDPGEKENCLRAGCNDFIFKPFSVSELMERISLLLD
jgi:DNA-binding response OmpR family regulator